MTRSVPSAPRPSIVAAVLRSRWPSPLLLLLLWEAASRAGLIPTHTLAAPSAVLATLFAMIRSGELPSNLAVSFWRVVSGLGIGVALGVSLGLVAGLSRRGEALVDPLMQIKRTIPVVALAPLFIVWFGIGETPKIALIAFAVMFPLYLNLYNGIRGVDKRLVEGALSFGLDRWQLIVHVILPGALPSLLVGLRYALTISIVMLVIAEQINASAGLGFLVNNARDFMRTDIIVVCLMVYALLGLAADLLVRAVETRALAWRPKLVEA
ncbi:ABC transporter permease subunit [Sphingomonas histidinilytica]|jgi:sulfonate transport system permease protein|uniref:Sulfonate transport system permease protein n=1 Tax=Rhizorhabdus histidinilytica TaxID=439228 RepID=A0A1T5FHD2_9SPHN|nr:ABC transporter permease [Rhizorhabdus histidinilytica]MBO9375614.1 ABC transporter permease subunit [Rhizorhabdus histidinilytica]QEH81057.1 ABC transporter permease [Sphingomonas sp. C8-2]SKB95614.1 sulfonate transport system permease protein [Rhizorhabdus histidinilytica]